MSDAPSRFRRLLERPGTLVVPGVANAFYAKMAEQAQFEAVFTSGAGIANSLLGAPDIGLVTLTEIVTATRYVANSVTIPVIADGDTGYGNRLNVMRTVSELERTGAAGLFIEDQVAPKRCGHFPGTRVTPVSEMVEKLVAATLARTNPEFLLTARTDAIATEGFEGALRRAQAYVDAGADMIFVEAPTTLEQLVEIPKTLRVPCVVNMVEGGVTPLVAADELAKMGYKVILYANLALRVAGYAVRRAFRVLRQEGASTGVIGEMLTWDERQSLVGLPDWEELDQRIQERASSARGPIAGRTSNSSVESRH